MRLRWNQEEIIMKRIYSEMILKSMMSNNSEDIVKNILDYMETLNDDYSNVLMDIITGVEHRSVAILNSFKEQDLINAANNYIDKNFSSKKNVISVSMYIKPCYDSEFSTKPGFSIIVMYEYENKKKISKEKFEEYSNLKQEFFAKYHNKYVAEMKNFDAEKSTLYNFVGRCQECNDEDAVEVCKIDYNSYYVDIESNL